jgi:predicted transcriptional regulator
MRGGERCYEWGVMSDRLLTDVELEVMAILWRLGKGSVHDVLGELPRGRDLAYTTVSTTLRILEQKEFVKSTQAGKRHVYAPRVTKARYEKRSVGHVVENVFEGDAGALVRTLVDGGALDDEEMRALRALLDERLDK